MEQLIDPVATVCPDNTALLRFAVLFNHVSNISDQHSRLYNLYGFFQCVSRTFYNSNVLWVCFGFVSHVVCFVEIAVETSVIDRNVNVDNISILEDVLVWYAVTYDLVYRCANGFGEI